MGSKYNFAGFLCEERKINIEKRTKQKEKVAFATFSFWRRRRDSIATLSLLDLYILAPLPTANRRKWISESSNLL
ncbi:MAG: hypothetical protein PUE46_08355 [Eubacteriales bacterium]|nr:hypothetical protein [Eubacteriales bacterium]